MSKCNDWTKSESGRELERARLINYFDHKRDGGHVERWDIEALRDAALARLEEALLRIDELTEEIEANGFNYENFRNDLRQQVAKLKSRISDLEAEREQVARAAWEACRFIRIGRFEQTFEEWWAKYCKREGGK